MLLPRYFCKSGFTGTWQPQPSVDTLSPGTSCCTFPCDLPALPLSFPDSRSVSSVYSVTELYLTKQIGHWEGLEVKT